MPFFLFPRFQEHIKKHAITEVISVEEFLALRRTVSSKQEGEADSSEVTEGVDEAPPGVEEDAVKDSSIGDTAASAGVSLASVSSIVFGIYLFIFFFKRCFLFLKKKLFLFLTEHFF